ncbi:hypothetical protein LJC53_05655 [Bacteroidales bacterium OttesenSCG-928-C03]|nr:hypothetical protein [Bacteroidales bacterium OttesenSCG-928-E04]MDL2309050.1 hypothetical protein [Bacteroidales bacterium OttesenSCG-928-C03]
MMKKIFLLFSIFLLLSSVSGQINVKDSIDFILKQKDLKPEERMNNVREFVVRNEENYTFDEDDLALFHEKVIPFIQKEVKDELRRNALLAWTYHFGRNVYYNSGNREKENDELKKALRTIEMETDDKLIEARIYFLYGIYQMEEGDIAQGHEYFYKSIEQYDQLEQYEKVVNSLYHLAINFQEIKDAAGLKRVIEQMEEYVKKAKSVQADYQLNTIKSVYYSELIDKEKSDYTYLDSAILCGKRNIALIEKWGDEVTGGVNPAWTYYNIAVDYNEYYSDEYDTMYFYLDKTMECTQGRYDEKEVYISVNILYGEILLRQGKYEQAEKEMLHALSLLEEYENYNIVIAEYREIYNNLVVLYEKKGNFAEALKYQRLLQENEKRRYDNDKITAINEMSFKYETEKKEAYIALLEERHRTTRLIATLIAGLAMILLITIIFIISFYRLRKKNLEQVVYESALLAELKQNELLQNREEREKLQEKYDNLEKLAGQSEKKANQYAEELEQIQQKLEQKPIQLMVEKIAGEIKKSLIEKNKKEKYLNLLSDLDIDMLEQGYLAAHEKITNMDMKYIICFLIDMNIKDIGLLFNIEPPSVRTVRYRIKKKFGEKDTFKFLI